jgi:pantetheine-phosphate adenylyltransferase
MDKIAVFPGSFDPFTIGHESIVLRALPMFDKIIFMIGYNTNKQSFFKLSKRLHWVQRVFAGEPKVEVMEHEGLTVDFCKKAGASYILRGLRTSSDFEYERAIAQMNKKLYPTIETVFLLTMPEHTPINSSIVRDIILHGGDASMFLPKALNMEEFKREEE